MIVRTYFSHMRGYIWNLHQWRALANPFRLIGLMPVLTHPKQCKTTRNKIWFLAECAQTHSVSHRYGEVVGRNLPCPNCRKHSERNNERRKEVLQKKNVRNKSFEFLVQNIVSFSAWKFHKDWKDYLNFGNGGWPTVFELRDKSRRSLNISCRVTKILG